jgi:LuxR family transcriptional regulator, quorum-sensing system regulator BjaR1
MLARIMEHAEGAFRATTPEEASARFFDAAKAFGATYLQTRLYRRPAGPLTSPSHYAAGGFLARMAPASWPHSEAFNYVCFQCNPLLAAIRENRTRYRFTDFAPRGDRNYGAYWEAMAEAGIADALCATSYGAGGMIASLHLGFPDREIGPEESLAVQLSGLVLTEKLMTFANCPPDQEPLTRRERDVLALVAEGKTDWEISVILGVSEATARFHVDNARRKLGAVTRAQAVARLIGRRLL